MRDRPARYETISNVWKQLRRFLTADPGRFAAGSALTDPLGLLASEQELLPLRPRPPERIILHVTALPEHPAPGRTEAKPTRPS